MSPMAKPLAVVPDANVLIGVCAKEIDKHKTAETAIEGYLNKGYEFFAPNVIVAEVIFIFCQKLAAGLITETEYDTALESFKSYLSFIHLTPSGEASLIDRAVEIVRGYGCSRSSDCLYISLAEELSKNFDTELLTFDKGMMNQTGKNAPIVQVRLLPI